MNYRQTKSFTNRIVGERDVAKLEKILDEAFNADLEIANAKNLAIPGMTYFGRLGVEKSVKCDDLSAFTISYDLDSLTPARICDQPEFIEKKVREITLEFKSMLDENKQISISFSEGRYKDTIDVLISSSSKDFLQLYFSKITDTIQSMRQHDNFYTRHPALAAIICIVVLNQALNSTFDGLALVLIKFNLLPAPPNLGVVSFFKDHVDFFNRINWGRNLLLATVIYFGNFKPYLQSMFPPIEFEFVPEHRRRAFQKRKSLAFLATAICLPAVIGIIVNLITG